MSTSSDNKKIHISPFSRRIYNENDLRKILNPNSNHGICGSVNLGNTCFMNSSIACISNCIDLTYYFLSKKFVQDINSSNRDGTGGELAKAWYRIIEYYWNSRYQSGNPKLVKNIVATKNRKFSGYNQQDSNEFMTVFLEILGEDLNRANKKIYRELKEQQKGESDVEAAQRFWKLHIERNDNIITDLFHGLLKSTITCPKCNYKSITYDPFNTLALTIPNEKVINYLNQNRNKKKEKKIEKIKKQRLKEKEIIDIYYVPPFSFRNTIHYKIDIYKKWTSLNKIAKEIKERNDEKYFNTNLIFMSVSSKQCDNFLDANIPFKNKNYTFAFANESKVNNQICIPIYLSYNKELSAYPRVLFLDKNDSYYELKKKIYFLVRKYLKNPFSENNRYEEFIEDKKLEYYINGNTDNLQDVISSLNNEFNNLQKSYNRIKDYNKNIPYQIFISENFNDINKIHLISEGMFDQFNILSNLNISSNHDKIETLVNLLIDKKLFLSINLNKSSRFVKQNISLNSCIGGTCRPLKEEYETYYEEMEIEDDSDDDNYENNYSNSNNITLDHCLQYFTFKESLEEGNEWICDKCRKRVMASKQIELFYLPRILCICLTRFIKQGRYYSYTKNTKLVEFPLENLNMEKYMCGPDKKYSKYDLYAVSQHYGSMGGGHYTAICKNIDGNWYCYDDESVFRTSNKNVVTSEAYVLFYRRKGW